MGDLSFWSEQISRFFQLFLRGAAFCKDPTSKSDAPGDQHVHERTAPLEDTILETSYRGGQLDN